MCIHILSFRNSHHTTPISHCSEAKNYSHCFFTDVAASSRDVFSNRSGGELLYLQKKKGEIFASDKNGILKLRDLNF